MRIENIYDNYSMAKDKWENVMKKNKIIWFMLLSIFLFEQKCDVPSEPDPNFKSSAGDAILVNPISFREEGVRKLFINKNDTIKLELKTVTFNDEEYTISSTDGNLLEINQDSLWIVAKGEVGGKCDLVINDITNNLEKVIPVEVVEQWADPICYTFLGTFGGHSYYISTLKDNWDNASAFCDGVLSNGHLFVPNSFEEHTAVSQMVDRLQVWIGLTNAGVNVGKPVNEMFWVNGDAVTDSFEPYKRGKLIEGGGGSYYFLNENRIYVKADEKVQKLWLLEVE